MLDCVAVGISPEVDSASPVGGGDVLDRIVGAVSHIHAITRGSCPAPGQIQSRNQRVGDPSQPQRDPRHRTQLTEKVDGQRGKGNPIHVEQPQPVGNIGDVIAGHFHLRVVSDPHEKTLRIGQIVVQVPVAQSPVTCGVDGVPGTRQIVLLDCVPAGVVPEGNRCVGIAGCTGKVVMLDCVAVGISPEVDSAGPVGGGDVLDRIVGAVSHIHASAGGSCPARPRYVQVGEKISAAGV